MIVVDTLAHMRRVLPSCACAEMANLTEEYAGGQGPDQLSFTALFGGPVCMVEAYGELGLIVVAEEFEGRSASLLDFASGSFDVAEWVCGGEFARFLVIDNDLGGTQYFVPREVAATCSNVGGSIQLFSNR